MCVARRPAACRHPRAVDSSKEIGTAVTHSHAAYAREDVEDAKAGRPAVSLEGWAAARGLAYRDSALLGAFTTVVPPWQEHVFNVCRGQFAPGRFGYAAHELAEVALDDSGSMREPGGYHSVHVLPRAGDGGRFLRGLLRPSILDAFVGEKPRTEAFAADAVWLPITTAAVRVPEAALLPTIRIRSADRYPPAGNPKLDDAGLPGFRMAGSQWVDEQLRVAVARAARPLLSLGGAYARMRLDRGVVAISRNGFVAPEHMDTVVAAAAAIADGLSEVAAPLLAAQPFEVPLPAPDPSTWPPGHDKPERHELDVLARVAAELGMVQEDPAAFHRACPRCPVPGRALGLVRGRLPGTDSEGRIGFFVQGGQTAGSYRSAVMVPARPGATSPLGGAIDSPSDLYLEVADGVAHAWPRARSAGALNAAATLEGAVGAFERQGLAAP